MEHPVDKVLRTLNLPVTGLSFPPRDWEILQQWGDGWALRCRGLRAIIDVEVKGDGRWWAHLSVSRKDWPPSHADMATTKLAFFGERYAYAVFPPADRYVNIHPNCLHLWALIDATDGRVLPEFSAVSAKFWKQIGRSI